MKHNFKYIIAATSFGVASLTSLQADLLNLVPVPPVITFNLDGTTTYDATSNNFILDATPLSMIDASGTDFFDIAESDLDINIDVDENGNISSGNVIPDLILTGIIYDDEVVEGSTATPLYNGSTTQNPLLTGKITDFGFFNNSTNDVFDFRFEVTGGILASIYQDDLKDLYVRYTSEGSTFEDFNSDFSGGAKGNIYGTEAANPIPEPSTYAFIAGSIALGFGFIRRRLKK